MSRERASTGVHELIRLTRELCERPRFWGRNQGREIRGETALPLICLQRTPDAAHFLTPLAGALRNAGPEIPVAHVDAEEAAARIAERWREVQERTPPLLPLLDELRHQLGVGTHNGPRLTRFDLYRLVDMLTGTRFPPSAGRDDRAQVAELVSAWNRGRVKAEGSELQESAPGSITQLMIFLVRLTPLPRWARTYLLRFSRDARWLMRRQHFMTPNHSVDFPDFAERLSVGRRGSESEEQLKKLLVHAFLEDLRRVYRRRRLKIVPNLRGWRRTAYVVALLENVSRENGGWELLQLINAVRNETGEIDPLLVIAESGESPLIEGSELAVAAPEDAFIALERWRRSLPSKRQRHTDDARYLPIRLPVEAGASSDRWPEEETFQVRRAPVLARQRVLPGLVVVALVACLTPAAVIGWRLQQHGCLRVLDTTDIRADLVEVAPDDPQCVGYSSSGDQLFGDNPRLLWGQRAVQAQNKVARELHRADPDRPYLALVYFAGFTHLETDVDTDHAIAEELEGLLLQQRKFNIKSKVGPLLRIIVANGGNEMRAAVTVTERMLLPLLAEDSSVLGVIGLDRTVEETRDAIKELGGNGIPVAATTLTGSGLLELTPLYFQLVPGNDKQAVLIDGYADAVGATEVTVYHPRLTERESYIGTLVEEMRTRRPEARVVSWGESVSSLPRLCADERDRSRELVYYVGREDDFGDFLTQLTEGCDRERLPAIIGADAVSRFIVNEESRRNPVFAELPVSYVGMGGHAVFAGAPCLKGVPAPAVSGAAMKVFCTSYGELRRELEQAFPRENPGMSWPSERAALSHDAAGLFVEAVKRMDLDAPAGRRLPPHRAAVAQVLRESDFGFEGVTGLISFSDTRVGNPANLAVLRIPEVNDLEAQPVCSYMLQDSRKTSYATDPVTHCPKPSAP